MDHRALYVLLGAPLLAFAAQTGVTAHKAPADAAPARPQAAQARAAAADTAADTDSAPQRRSRMAEAAPAQRPSFHFTAEFHEAVPDASDKDNCLQHTGTRLKRQGQGVRACASGNGVVYRVD